MRQVLRTAGFDVDAILKIWKDRGWLETDTAGRGKQVRINGIQVYCYSIKKSAIEGILKIMGKDDERDA